MSDMTFHQAPVILAAFIILSGCAPSLSGANEKGGIVEHVIGLNREDAFKTANEHCKSFGRVAKVTEQNTLASTLVFECVAP